MFKRIIVAVDGSDAAKHALTVACDLAGKYGSEIHLLHSPQVETSGIAVGSGVVEIKPDHEEIVAAGQKVLEEANTMAASEGREVASSIIGENHPAADILDAIKDINADLVVMGRRGLGRLTSLILGSVSQKVSHEASCTCMTVS